MTDIYPYRFSVLDYASCTFDQRSEVDQWLRDNFIIPEITKAFTLETVRKCLAEQYEVVEGKLAISDRWPRIPVVNKLYFGVKGYEFPLF